MNRKSLTRACMFLSMVAVAWIAPSLGRAQETASRGGRVADEPSTTPGPAAGDLSEEEGDWLLGAPGEPWQGPRIELGYTHYVLTDGQGAGSVNAGFFGGYLPLGWARVGFGAEAGSRSYELGPDDFIARGRVILGYQHLDWQPAVPFIAAVGTAGLILGKRFHSTVSHFIYGAGVEVGADFNIVRTLYTGGSFSFVRVTMWDLSYNLFVFRLRVGL
ncbi:MAG: hypothetical protein KC416_06310 [Myxococcales bacterium]|nr:hypothetical protein [Myxococcales bacterium]